VPLTTREIQQYRNNSQQGFCSISFSADTGTPDNYRVTMAVRSTGPTFTVIWHNPTNPASFGKPPVVLPLYDVERQTGLDFTNHTAQTCGITPEQARKFLDETSENYVGQLIEVTESQLSELYDISTQWARIRHEQMLMDRQAATSSFSKNRPALRNAAAPVFESPKPQPTLVREGDVLPFREP
jgi:hypothetical protein